MVTRNQARPRKKVGRQSIYRHLLKALHVGDVIYLTERHERMDKAVTGAAFRMGIGVTTANFVATNLDPKSSHRVLRIERTS